MNEVDESTTADVETETQEDAIDHEGLAIEAGLDAFKGIGRSDHDDEGDDDSLGREDDPDEDDPESESEPEGLTADELHSLSRIGLGQTEIDEMLEDGGLEVVQRLARNAKKGVDGASKVISDIQKSQQQPPSNEDPEGETEYPEDQVPSLEKLINEQLEAGYPKKTAAERAKRERDQYIRAYEREQRQQADRTSAEQQQQRQQFLAESQKAFEADAEVYGAEKPTKQQNQRRTQALSIAKLVQDGAKANGISLDEVRDLSWEIATNAVSSGSRQQKARSEVKAGLKKRTRSRSVPPNSRGRKTKDPTVEEQAAAAGMEVLGALRKKK